MAKKRILDPTVKGGYRPYVQGELSDGEKVTLRNAKASKENIEMNKARKAAGLPIEPDPTLVAKVKAMDADGSGDEEFAVGGSNDSGLSSQQRDMLQAGLSIPQMKQMAKELEIEIPKHLKKKPAIANFLLSYGNDDSGEDKL